MATHDGGASHQQPQGRPDPVAPNEIRGWWRSGAPLVMVAGFDGILDSIEDFEASVMAVVNEVMAMADSNPGEVAAIVAADDATSSAGEAMPGMRPQQMDQGQRVGAGE